MPDKTPPKPTLVLDHRANSIFDSNGGSGINLKARDTTALEQAEAQFANNLVTTFHTMVLQSALEQEGAPLASLTLAQMHELLACLREALALPTPPEDD